MWIGILSLNLLCFATAVLVLQRLLRPVPAEDRRESFAHVLAVATPLAQHLADREVSGSQKAAAPPLTAVCPLEAEQPRPDLPACKRLAVVRHILQGASVEETTEATGVSETEVRALYALHGRGGVKTC